MAVPLHTTSKQCLQKNYLKDLMAQCFVQHQSDQNVTQSHTVKWYSSLCDSHDYTTTQKQNYKSYVLYSCKNTLIHWSIIYVSIHNLVFKLTGDSLWQSPHCDTAMKLLLKYMLFLELPSPFSYFNITLASIHQECNHVCLLHWGALQHKISAWWYIYRCIDKFIL